MTNVLLQYAELKDNSYLFKLGGFFHADVYCGFMADAKLVYLTSHAKFQRKLRCKTTVTACTVCAYVRMSRKLPDTARSSCPQYSHYYHS